ncbi:MAG: NapC/NirT family cytochrome c [Desulfarculaceae bacterium]|nr:NapC/NirT family cytochrome c [Desulfarculaceae bacterium]MCF8072299.1 NapC/NirT family cytochrome c [Desulfarculaceae bacterium]MCF8100220.1 NapC/NirT family cytochrome c [Desulfarculaceae bacterium]MCF8116207.1 NapC/NirT family cytochrome c [Desulfarculaceae bacterium]
MAASESKSSYRWAWAYALAAAALCAALGLAWWSQMHRPWQEEVRAINHRRAMQVQEDLLKAGMNQQRAADRAQDVAEQPPRMVEIVPSAFGKPERCLTCHQGLAQISPSHPVEAMGCVACHGGQGEALTKAEAHRGLLGRNPSALSTARASCGGRGAAAGRCHAGRGDPAADMVYRVERTIMATMTGVITSLRVAWGSQNDFTARYATASIADPRRPTPPPSLTLSALVRISAAPPSGLQPKQVADEQWNKFCARCHLWAERQAGLSAHGKGCAACHGTRDPSGRYLGQDATIDREEAGHAAYHRLSETPPEENCRRCHNRSGRLALNYRGQVEDENGRTPWPQGRPEVALSGGRGVHALLPDVHADKGMSCLDCHSSREIMGDGRLYGRMRHQTELRCSTCHGDAAGPPRLGPPDAYARYEAAYGPLKDGPPLGDDARLVLSAKGRPLLNLRLDQGKLVLLSRVSPGKKHPVPQIHDDPRHLQPGHQRLACQACHSRWAPQCYGCHDYRRANSAMWSFAADKFTPGYWQESRDLYRFSDPTLALGGDGLIKPFVPGCQVIYTALNNQGLPLPGLELKVPKPGLIISGIVMTPIAPHTTRKEVRPCEACHLSGKALGLGGGPRALGALAALPLADLKAVGHSADWDALVGPKGEPLQSSTHQGARPLNKQEIARVIAFGRCLPCHRDPKDPVLADPAKAWQRIGPGGDLRAKHRRMEAKALR